MGNVSRLTSAFMDESSEDLMTEKDTIKKKSNIKSFLNLEPDLKVRFLPRES